MKKHNPNTCINSVPCLDCEQPKTKYIQIKNTNHLARLCNLKNREGFICLNGGLRSSKIFYWNGEQFEIQNLIDDSAQNLTPCELYTRSNIGEAIIKKSLFIEHK